MTGHTHKKQYLTACLAAVLPPLTWGGIKLSDTWCSLAFAIFWAQLTNQELVALAGLGVYYYTYVIVNSLGMFDAVFGLRTYQTYVDNVTRLLKTAETASSKAKDQTVASTTVTKHTKTLRHCKNRLDDRTSHKNAIIAIGYACLTMVCMCVLWAFDGFTPVVLSIHLFLTVWQSCTVVYYEYGDYHERKTTPPLYPPVELQPLVQSLCDRLDKIIAHSLCISISYITLLTVALVWMSWMTLNQDTFTKEILECANSKQMLHFVWGSKYQPGNYRAYSAILRAVSKSGDTKFGPVASDMGSTLFSTEKILGDHASSGYVCQDYVQYSCDNNGICNQVNQVSLQNICAFLIRCINVNAYMHPGVS